MLTKGLNHVAVLTNDIPGFIDFCARMFEAEVLHHGAENPDGSGPEMAVIKIGPWSELNVFRIEGNTEADRQIPMFGRGRLDHFALQAASIEAFDEIRDRLMASGAADDFVTDFGQVLSLFFRGPEGLEGEVCVDNPDAAPGVQNGPGNRAARYS